MKKVIIFIFLLCSFSINCFSVEVQKQNEIKRKQYPRMDGDLRYYLPSALGHVTGANPSFGLRKDLDFVDDCINYMIEGRGSILPYKNVFFSWSFAAGGYIERNTNQEENFSSFNISLGAGLYYHIFSFDKYDLTGLCMFLYPMYQVPVHTDGIKSYLKWKSALDIGYNFLLLDCITVYPYVRNIFGVTSDGMRYGFDCGFSMGIYFRDN